MPRYLLGRLFRFVSVVLAASFIVYLALYVFVDPVKQILPIDAPPEQVARVRTSLGLDDPFLVQYGRYIWNIVAHGDFGQSLWLGQPAGPVVLSRLAATAQLALITLGLALFVGLLLGVWSATSGRGSTVDRFVSSSSYFGISVSDVWVAIMLVLIFAVRLDWFQTSGYGLGPETLVLPVVTLAMRPAAQLTQVVREAVLNELESPYVITAMGKGVGRHRIYFVHVLRNALPRVVTFAAYDLGRIFAGTAVVVETIFAWPGIGLLAVESLRRGDVFLASAVVIVAASVVALLNLAADLLHVWLDPRLRVGDAA